jgi:hypothetical protein
MVVNLAQQKGAALAVQTVARMEKQMDHQRVAWTAAGMAVKMDLKRAGMMAALMAVMKGKQLAD